MVLKSWWRLWPLLWRWYCGASVATDGPLQRDHVPALDDCDCSLPVRVVAKRNGASPRYHVHQVWFQAELENFEAAETARAALLQILQCFEAGIPKEMVFNYFTGPLVRKAFAGWKKAGLVVHLPPEMAALPKPVPD